jgi:DNA end-binding protein Ku
MHEFGMRRAGRSAASPHAGMVASGAPDSTSEPVARMLLPKVQAEYPVMPASRPYWKGYLKLSLVSCPIALYTASASSERVSFRQVNKKTGNRLRQQLVDDVTRESVEAADKGRGYEVAKNTFILIDDEELDAVAIESTHTIEIDSFVPRAQIDERYFESPYYIVPNDQVGQEAFAVIREAMRDKGMVALGRVVLSKRERVVMLQPWDRGLMGTTLRYAYELRDSHDYFDQIPDLKVPKDMLELAEHIVASKTADFNPAIFVDRYEEAVVEMLKTKQAGLPAAQPREVPAPNVINLMDALRRSIAEGGAAPPAKDAKAPPAVAATAPPAAAATSAAAKGRKPRAPKPEDLRSAPQFKFPITGGKGKTKEEQAPTEVPKSKSRRKSA